MNIKSPAGPKHRCHRVPGDLHWDLGTVEERRKRRNAEVEETVAQQIGSEEKVS